MTINHSKLSHQLGEACDSINRIPSISCYRASGQRDELCSLEMIWQRVDRSNSWGYSIGLVPMFDENGEKVPTKTNPPWPWAVLPDPVIKIGKKQWLTSSIDQWFAQMHARARGSAKANAHADIQVKKDND